MAHALAHVTEGPYGEHLATCLEFEGLALVFTVVTGPGVAIERFPTLVELLRDVPEDLHRDTVREWLAHVGERTPVYRAYHDKAEAREGGATEHWQPVSAEETARLLSDDPFAHPVELPFVDEDGHELVDAPVWARTRRVLTRAGWTTTSPGAAVLGMGLDLRHDSGAAVFDAGWVNDDFVLRVSLRARRGETAEVEFRVGADDVGGESFIRPGTTHDLPRTDRVLRLLLEWQERLRDERQLAWFAAELAAAAPGSAVGSFQAEPDSLPGAPVPPSFERVDDKTRLRADAMVERLVRAGWRSARPDTSALYTTLAAVERVDTESGDHWYCAYVLTGRPRMPEALCVHVSGEYGPEPTLDGLVDVLGLDDPPMFGVETATQRLASLLDRLAVGGPRIRVSAGLGLLGAFVSPTPHGVAPLPVSAVMMHRWDRPEARPLAEVADAPERTWLEAGFAAYDEGRWHLAVRAFERAALEEPGRDAGLADLWIGALRYEADPVAAIGALDRAATAGRMPADARFLESELHRRAGDREARLGALARATEEDGERPEVWSRYGLALAKCGRPQEAVRALTEALARNVDATVLWYRGYAHLRAGDRSAALSDLTAAARLDMSLAREIHADPDLAALRDEPEFEALLDGPVAMRADVERRVRALLEMPGWQEDEEGQLVRTDDNFGGSIFAVTIADTPDQPGTVYLNIDDGVSGFLFFRVELAGRPEPFVDVMSRWPEEFAESEDNDLEGWVDVDALVAALIAAYPGAVSFHRLGGDWVRIGPDG